jgi:signal transduction histidine kinase
MANTSTAAARISSVSSTSFSTCRSRDCVTLVETQARRADVSLSAVVANDLPLIRADDRRIRQILINLLANAVKFTPEGGRVQVSACYGSGGFLLNVSDTGIGMLPEHIAKALEPFGQVDSAMSRKYEGTGLGLPIAKQLAALHGGSLSITSTWNAGTTVSVTLPAQRAMTRQVLLEPARASA